MSSLKTLRLRVKSIRSTQKITKAMQMVSASKLRRAKEAMEGASTYHNLITDTLNNVVLHNRENLSPLAKMIINQSGSEKHVIALVVTSDRGLCGGFNNQVLKKAMRDIDAMKSRGVNVSIVTIGKKGRDWMISKYGASSVVLHYALPNAKSMTQSVNKMYHEILDKIMSGSFDGFKVYFNHFNSAISQVPQICCVIPKSEYHNDNAPQFSEYEGGNLLDSVIKMYIESELYNSILDSKVSEEAARMVAMDNATKNAGDIIQQLTLVLNRTRQAIITKELIEIISGAEAV